MIMPISYVNPMFDKHTDMMLEHLPKEWIEPLLSLSECGCVVFNAEEDHLPDLVENKTIVDISIN